MKAKKMKLLLMTVLVSIMLVALGACGNDSEPEPTPEPTPIATPEPTPTPEPEPEEEPEVEDEDEEYEVPEEPDDIADLDGDLEAYLAAMGEFIVAFEDLMDVLFDLVELLDYIETDEDFVDWVDAFEIIKHAVAVSEAELTASALLAPMEYMESHIMIAAAVSLVYDSMVELDHALLAALMGDDDALWAGVEGFVINILAADMLWEEAIYG